MYIQVFFNNADNQQNSKAKDREGKFTHTFITYMGAFLLSIILVVFIHETGHYLAYKMRGYDAVNIRINPFMGTTSCQQPVQEQDFFYIILGGTILNLSLATISTIAFHFVKNPAGILAKMYSAAVFLIEGMVIIAGLFFQETITDFSWLMELGLSPFIITFLGVTLTVIGGYLSYEIWISLGINSRTQLLLINLPLFAYWLLGFIFGMAILPIEISFFRRFLAVILVLQSLYLVLRIIFAPMLMPRIQKRMPLDSPKVTFGFSILSLFLGCAFWALSFIVLN